MMRCSIEWSVVKWNHTQNKDYKESTCGLVEYPDGFQEEFFAEGDAVNLFYTHTVGSRKLVHFEI